VRKYVVRREIKKKDKTFFKSPKIQRLITEKRIRNKKLIKNHKKDGFKAKKEARAKYEKVLSQYIKERKALHAKKEGEAKPAVEEKKVAVVEKKAPTAGAKGGKKAEPVKKAPVE
jgi:superfamily I DNA and/or RNA helicase